MTGHIGKLFQIGIGPFQVSHRFFQLVLELLEPGKIGKGDQQLVANPGNGDIQPLITSFLSMMPLNPLRLAGQIRAGSYKPVYSGWIAEPLCIEVMPFACLLPVLVHLLKTPGHPAQEGFIEPVRNGFGIRDVHFTNLIGLFIRSGFDFDDIFAIPGVQTNAEMRVGNILNKTHDNNDE